MSSLILIKDKELSAINGGVSAIPYVSVAVTILRLGYSLYEYTKDKAENAGIKKAYTDMGITTP